MPGSVCLWQHSIIFFDITISEGVEVLMFLWQVDRGGEKQRNPQSSPASLAFCKGLAKVENLA